MLLLDAENILFASAHQAQGCPVFPNPGRQHPELPAIGKAHWLAARESRGSRLEKRKSMG